MPGDGSPLCGVPDTVTASPAWRDGRGQISGASRPAHQIALDHVDACKVVTSKSSGNAASYPEVGQDVGAEQAEGPARRRRRRVGTGAIATTEMRPLTFINDPTA